MKKIILSVTILAIAFSSTFMACRKENEYSCDEKANSYAAQHKETNQSISRDSLVQLERSTQFAVWRSLSSENKKRIFNEKIDLVISTENLSTAEVTHLNSLKNYYVADLYDSTEKPFLVTWENYAKNTLGWDNNKLTLLVGIWSTPNELVKAAERGGNPAPLPKCSCAWDAGCAGFGDCAVRGGCIGKIGCGLIGTSNCDGTCPEDVRPTGSGSTY